MTIFSIYPEIEQHLMHDEMPSVYLNSIYDMLSQYPFDMLHRLRHTEQSPQHHPEGNVWNHTLLVVDEAAKVRQLSRDPYVFVWAALLHDIGKPATTRIRKGKITAYDHDKAGAELSKEFLQQFSDDGGFIQKVSDLIRYHMQMLFVLNNLPYSDIRGMKRHTDMQEVALLCYCDRMGRTNSDRNKEETNMRLFLDKCK